MPSSFPGAIDNFTDPLAGSPLNSPSHSGQHSDLNDAVEKIETYMGLVKVIPTGATNGTVGATGTVTIGNAVASVTIAGAFSSLYDDYLVRVSGVSATNDNADFNWQLRSGGTTANSSYFYVYHYVNYATGAIAVAQGSNQTAYNFAGRVTTDTLSTVVDISQPFLARRTVFRALNVGGNIAGPSTGYHNAATSYDGLIMTIGSGTITGGTVTIYGYRK